jgi:hypothetical protein
LDEVPTILISSLISRVIKSWKLGNVSQTTIEVQKWLYSFPSPFKVMTTRSSSSIRVHIDAITSARFFTFVK